MYPNLKILAFIGARAGSKGLPNKNILELGGKPLVSWTIEAALNSRYITDTIVSSDSPEVQKAALELGVLAPFLRPKELASDDAAIEDAIVHALTWLKDHKQQTYDLVVMLQPTSPLRTNHHIDNAIEYYLSNRHSEDDTLVSVVKAADKCAWLLVGDDSGRIKFCFPQPEYGHSRQKLPTYYLPNGAIYIGKTSETPRGFYTESTLFYEMDDDVSVDIDVMDDLLRVRDEFNKRVLKT